MEKPIPKVGEIWQHYKHDPSMPNSYTYKILVIGFDTEKQIPVVVYQPIYEMPEDFVKVGAEAAVRGLGEFMEEVEVNGQRRPRFIKLG